MHCTLSLLYFMTLGLGAAFACSPPPCTPESTSFKELPFDRLIRTQQMLCFRNDSSYVKVDTLYRSDMLEAFYKTIHGAENVFFAEILEIKNIPDLQWDSTSYRVLKTLKGDVEEKSSGIRLSKSGSGGDCSFKMVNEGAVLLTSYDDVNEWNFNNSRSKNYFYLKNAKDSLIRNDNWPQMTIHTGSVNWARYGKDSTKR